MCLFANKLFFIARKGILAGKRGCFIRKKRISAGKCERYMAIGLRCTINGQDPRYGFTRYFRSQEAGLQDTAKGQTQSQRTLSAWFCLHIFTKTTDDSIFWDYTYEKNIGLCDWVKTNQGKFIFEWTLTSNGIQRGLRLGPNCCVAPRRFCFE